MKQVIEEQRTRLKTAAADKERISDELIQQDLKFANWCPNTAKSAKAD
jgi:hypothetical protein